MPKVKTTSKRRDYESIINDVIDICKNRCRKTRIMYDCGLSFEQLNDYLKKTQNANYLTFDGNFYNATGKGKVFTHVYALLKLLSTTGKDKDPYADSKLKSQIQTTLSSLTSLNDSLEHLKLKKVDSFMVGHRSKYRVLADVIDEAVGGIRKTQMMYKCNLSFNQTKKVLQLTENTNLIEVKEDKKEYFFATVKGKMFSQLHRLMRYLMETGNSEDPFKDNERIKEIEDVLTPVLSFEIPKEAYVVPLEQITVTKR